MVLLKACPRCRGDIDNTWQDDIHCVQCGWRETHAAPPEAVELASHPRLFMRQGWRQWKSA